MLVIRGEQTQERRKRVKKEDVGKMVKQRTSLAAPSVLLSISPRNLGRTCPIAHDASKTGGMFFGVCPSFFVAILPLIMPLFFPPKTSTENVLPEGGLRDECEQHILPRLAGS